MPGYKGHIIGSMVAGGVAITAAVTLGYLSVVPLRLAGLLGFCVLGGLFPDVDTDSKGQNLYYSILIVVDGALIYYRYFNWAAWLGLCAMLPALGHHRGWTHTWWAMIVVGAPIIFIPVIFYGTDNYLYFLPFYISFTVGYFSHLLLDRKFI
jgi:membrane-bound metal-dependent hydrolase YbcI (DUF457 family)